ncbi:hypothetical protein [Schleiferia thermophila]|jgi:hypothetical protein|nr:hypothetical protein [Schleiferia thermophila]PMB31598.1 hypothetical protein CEN47_11350 [Fischerella thermalis CCMEE 5319]
MDDPILENFFVPTPQCKRNTTYSTFGFDSNTPVMNFEVDGGAVKGRAYDEQFYCALIQQDTTYIKTGLWVYIYICPLNFI